MVFCCITVIVCFALSFYFSLNFFFFFLVIVHWCGRVKFIRQAKDVVKAVKRRLQHKSSKVQFLALTVIFYWNPFIFFTFQFESSACFFYIYMSDLEMFLYFRLIVCYTFVAIGDNGEELWWLCPCSNCREKYTRRDGQNCQKEGKSWRCSCLAEYCEL